MKRNILLPSLINIQFNVFLMFQKYFIKGINNIKNTNLRVNKNLSGFFFSTF